ncbi:hypothetical protein TKK_0014044 [Trichogramma kaykai]|uniref:Mab-21-like HhH/H2TH-like domain-containing protein n=1 Tax=Trichogramma kaykai TaxID=54128 RepID=A0ABD2WFJ2_9HYME
MLGLSLKYHHDKTNELLENLRWIQEKRRKYWKLSLHCTDYLVPKTLSNGPLFTDESKLYWHAFATNEKRDQLYYRRLNYALKATLSKATVKDSNLKYVLLSERLIDVKRFDLIDRKNFIRKIMQFLRKQQELEVVCLEGLQVSKIEGFDILTSLSSSSFYVRFLYIWRFFQKNEYSIPRESDGLYKFDPYFWLNAIGNFRFLETISVNYSCVASDSGHVILQLANVLGPNWKWLQLLCQEDEIPDTFNERGEKNSVTIPDDTWIEVRKYSPKLKVQIFMIGIPHYDQHKKFLTANILVETFSLATNLQFVYDKPCFIDCTLKTIYLWYHRTLVQLHINLWNHREFIDAHLRLIFARLPNLKFFEYIGQVQDFVTILTMCCQIKYGVTRPELVHLQIPKPADKENHWLSKIHCYLNSLKEDFEKLEVKFVVDLYPF